MKQEGWQDFTGDVLFDIPDSKDCKELTAARGDFKVELCCDSTYAGFPFNAGLSYVYGQVPVETRRNDDIAVVWDCIRRFFYLLFYLKKNPPRPRGAVSEPFFSHFPAL